MVLIETQSSTGRFPSNRARRPRVVPPIFFCFPPPQMELPARFSIASVTNMIYYFEWPAAFPVKSIPRFLAHNFHFHFDPTSMLLLIILTVLSIRSCSVWWWRKPIRMPYDVSSSAVAAFVEVLEFDSYGSHVRNPPSRTINWSKWWRSIGHWCCQRQTPMATMTNGKNDNDTSNQEPWRTMMVAKTV